MISNELKRQDAFLTDVANEFRKSRSQSRFEILFNVMANPEVSKKKKRKIWEHVIRVQFMKGAVSTDSKKKGEGK